MKEFNLLDTLKMNWYWLRNWTGFVDKVMILLGILIIVN